MNPTRECRMDKRNYKEIGPSPQGGLRLNRRELLFEEARRVDANTNERVLSVSLLTSRCAAIAESDIAKLGRTSTDAKSRWRSQSHRGH